MRVEKYGVVLRRLRRSDIETVRLWRNSPEIQRHMIFRETITPEMQDEWYRKIDNQDNFYFIITYDDERIGLADLKHIDHEQGQAEIGIFIAAKKYQNTHVAVSAIFCLAEFLFFILDFKVGVSKVLLSNKRSLEGSKRIGAEVLSRVDEQYYIMEYKRENYIRATSEMRRQALRLSGSEAPLALYLEQEDQDKGIAEAMASLCRKSAYLEQSYTEHGYRVFVFAVP